MVDNSRQNIEQETSSISDLDQENLCIIRIRLTIILGCGAQANELV
jgi:hypothetical protein